MNHAHNVFAIRGDRLFYAYGFYRVQAFDLKARKEIWDRSLRGPGAGPGDTDPYPLNIYVGKDVVVIYGNAPRGRDMEIRRAASGALLGHRLFGKRTKTAAKKLLKEYRGDVQMPDDLYQTYEQLVRVFTEEQNRILEFCVPHAITITTELRSEKSRAYGSMNRAFLKSGFQKQILGLRKDSQDFYLVRTATSYLFFVRTGSWLFPP